MKILYVTDLHGDISKYEKILEVALEKGFKTIVHGGDILPKRGNRYEIQDEFLESYLPAYFDRLEKNGIDYLVMLGNDDLVAYDKRFDRLCQKYKHIYNIAGKKVKIGDYEFIGMNYILDTPFLIKDRIVTEEGCERYHRTSGWVSGPDGYIEIKNWTLVLNNLPTIKEIMAKLPEPEDPEHTVYVIHQPPAGLGLDVTNSEKKVGSYELVDFISEVQPRFTLHGHIHESPWMSHEFYNTVGETICIQPGQVEPSDNRVVYVEIDLDTKEFDHKIVSTKKAWQTPWW